MTQKRKLYHKVWRVEVGSGGDGFRTPARATYLIESRYKNGIRTLEKIALKLAAEEGVTNPFVKGMAWVNSPYGDMGGDVKDSP